MLPNRLTLAQLRHFLLAHQGLLHQREFSGKQGVLDFITRVGCIQFDPLNVVGYNHELVLQARLHGFSPGWLQTLLYEERSLLDGWDKNMSIYSSRDWPCFTRLRQAARERFSHESRPAAAVFGEILAEIDKRGALSSADIDYEEAVDWAWAPTRLSRAALESLYFCGNLVVAEKRGTRKFYDLSHKLLPAALLDAPDPNPHDAAYDDWYLARRIGAVGALWNRPGGAWLGIAGFNTARRQAAFVRLEASGAIHRFEVEGLPHPVFVRQEDLHRLESTLASKSPAQAAAILAPLDNLLWDRDFVAAVFGFEYRWEVYKPRTERKHGYYVLPVLLGDRIVARFEPAKVRRGSPLHILGWWWEEGVSLDDDARDRLKTCFQAFMAYLGSSKISVDPGVKRRQRLAFLSRN